MLRADDCLRQGGKASLLHSAAAVVYSIQRSQQKEIRDRTRADRCADGEAAIEGAKSVRRISRFDFGRPARGDRFARVRRQGSVSTSVTAANQAAEEVLWFRSRCACQPPTDRNTGSDAGAWTTSSQEA